MFGTARIEAQLRETRDIAVRAETKTDAHTINCIEHNRRIEDMLTASAKTREEQHAENQRGQAETQETISSLKSRMLTMIISALCAAVLALFGALYSIIGKKMGL